MTKKEMYAHIAEELATETEVVDFCNKMISQLEKKTHNSKPTPKQIENEKYKKMILEALATSDEAMSIEDIMAANEELAPLSNQKISALITLLKKDGLVVRTEDKKKAFFSLA